MTSYDVDRARSIVREAGGEELASRLDHLDAHRSERRPKAETPPPSPPESGCAYDADVIVAGGGLWSILAPLLALRGLSVIVLERSRTGESHREWNASEEELQALVRVGLVDSDTLERLIVARYDYGTCRFASGSDYPVQGVLDRAVDAGALLHHARETSERAGVRLLDRHTVLAESTSRHGVRVRAASPHGTIDLTARVLVDARGVASPYATADLVCPTVGGVLRGLEEGDGRQQMNPRVGEILATIDGIEDGRQHVWEAFPGRAGETTVYVFYYAHATERTPLVDLYARFFETLPRYKAGNAQLVRPTFGFIPGWSRLAPGPRSPDRRIVLVGDAAARQSPLTYCGFGATLRSLEKTIEHVARLAHDEAPRGSAVDDAPIHGLTGALARMMAARCFEGHALNDLLDAAFATLHELGNPLYARLLRDEMTTSEFVGFLTRTAKRHPQVWGEVRRGLGFAAAGRWSAALMGQVVKGALGQSA